ncbi:hypothetical protein OGY18_03780 [Citrobacter sp. Cpo142]|uniref:hypothetical protein n=1 Tax=Citrobacter sp. Cpo142 TaxID=2985151 RepID=UPI002576F9F1|nr:hypothetical protein [Citrobacter sp. Cpo142]MDM2776281.1 hypothetical protein [Citrobacter sp. Cpo142]
MKHENELACVNRYGEKILIMKGRGTDTDFWIYLNVRGRMVKHCYSRILDFNGSQLTLERAVNTLIDKLDDMLAYGETIIPMSDVEIEEQRIIFENKHSGMDFSRDCQGEYSNEEVEIIFDACLDVKDEQRRKETGDKKRPCPEPLDGWCDCGKCKSMSLHKEKNIYVCLICYKQTEPFLPIDFNSSDWLPENAL